MTEMMWENWLWGQVVEQLSSKPEALKFKPQYHQKKAEMMWER
jgi:hypothetical protein